jgi:hypothetical protein
MTGARSRFGLERQGMRHLGTQHWNQSAPVLCEHAIRRGEGELAFGGSFSVSTGLYTGRTPRDKYIVEEPGTKDTVWWGPINQPVAPQTFDSLHQRMLAYLQGRELFIQDLYAGADPAYRLPVRVVTDSAWHSLFSRTMFIRPPVGELMSLRVSRRTRFGVPFVAVTGMIARLAEAAEGDFYAFLAGVRRDATAQGIRAPTVETALRSADFLPHVIELDRKQPEQLLTFSEYLEKVVTPQL